jgi:CelD/BcsL family acetyltransferase involved in cellulose biosynthesis
MHSTMTGIRTRDVWQVMPAAELPRFRATWNAIRSSEMRLPFLDAEFFELALEHFGSGGEKLAIASRNGSPVACGIFVPTGPFTWATFQPAQAPLGAWRCSAESAAPLVRRLAARLSPRCSMVAILQQDSECSAAFTARDAEQVEYIRTARLSITTSFDEYWLKRSKNLRHTMKRQLNGLERQGIVTSLRTVRDPNEARSAVAAYADIESRGWKGKSNTALSVDNAQGRFYSEWLHHCALRGEARVFEFRYGERLVASDLCVLRDGILTILKTTYDERETATSPGMLMHRQIFEEFHRGAEVCRVEFYGRVMDWHTRWTDEFRCRDLIPWVPYSEVRYVGAMRCSRNHCSSIANVQIMTP